MASRGVGRRRFGLPSRLQVELGDPLSFDPIRNQRQALVQLVDNVEDHLGDFFGDRSACQQPTNPQVEACTGLRRDERIGGFLSPIVQETVLSVLRGNGARLHGRPETAVYPCVGSHDITR
jgi:hypothetical protein